MFYINMDDNIRLAVTDLCPGNSDAVCFVHDWPMDMDVFEYQTDVLPSQGFRCISYDMRGFGRSDASPGNYTYDRLARDLYNVLRQLHPRNCTLVGYGMGGAVCVRYMSRFRGYGVSKLALVSAAVPCLTRRRSYPYGMSEETVKNMISMAYRDRPQMVEDYVEQVFANDVSKAMIRWMDDVCLTASGLATIQCAKTMLEEDLRGELASINVPTAIFHGTEDKITPFEFALLQKESIKNAELNEFSDCGHAVMIEYVEGFNNRLMHFMNR